MTVIRVLPQGTSGAYGVTNAATTALYTQALQNQKDTDSLKLQYQNALWEEKLQNSQLSTQLQYSQALAPYGISTNSLTGGGLTSGALGAGELGSTGILGGIGGLTSGLLGGLGIGGLGGLSGGFGGFGIGGGTSGQTNETSQSSPNAADQSVVNTNSSTESPVTMWPQSAWHSFGNSFSNFFSSL